MNGSANLQRAVDELKFQGNLLVICDLATSHGRNSTYLINQLFDFIMVKEDLINRIEQIIIYHEDLPDNDFDQVQQCLDDPTISYLQHPLITQKNISIEYHFIAKSYFNSLFAPNSVDIFLCYTAIHWIPEYYELNYGIIFEREREPLENQQKFAKLAHKYLLDWFNYRSQELKSGGVIFINIFNHSSIKSILNQGWMKTLNNLNFQQSELNQVRISAYFRSNQEIDNCLTTLRSKLKVINRDFTKKINPFGRDAVKAISYSQIMHGLSHYPEGFPTVESKEHITQSFLNQIFQDGQEPKSEDSFTWLAIQKN